MMNGTGGQPETHIGAFLCPGGRAITLLQSTAVGGAISRIVPQLEAGALVTMPRYFADTVVTEYGIARLLGKNHRERAAELIAIAHPDHRAELREAATVYSGKSVRRLNLSDLLSSEPFLTTSRATKATKSGQLICLTRQVLKLQINRRFSAE